MKKIIVLVICLLITTSVFAFDTGTKIIAGSVYYNSHKFNEDIDATNTFTLEGGGSYFLMPNISLDLLLMWQSVSQPYMKGSTSTISNIFLGAGGSYYFGNIYAMAAILYKIYSSKCDSKGDPWTQNGMYLGFGVGYLLPVVENVFVDIGANYRMGLGKYSGDAEGDNKETDLSIGAGLVVAIP